MRECCLYQNNEEQDDAALSHFDLGISFRVWHYKVLIYESLEIVLASRGCAPIYFLFQHAEIGFYKLYTNQHIINFFCPIVITLQ